MSHIIKQKMGLALRLHFKGALCIVSNASRRIITTQIPSYISLYFFFFLGSRNEFRSPSWIRSDSVVSYESVHSSGRGSGFVQRKRKGCQRFCCNSNSLRSHLENDKMLL